MDVTDERNRYDVIVVGGGTAGVAAAVGAARAGGRVLVLERSSVLGGAATLRNVLGYCGLYTCDDVPRKAVGGVADDVLARLKELGGVSPYGIVAGQWTVPLFDPEAVKRAMDDVVADAGVDVLLGSTLIAARREGNRITEISYTDFGGGTHEVTADTFVDASGDSTLAALGGAAVQLGAAGRRQTATMSIRFSGLRPGTSFDHRALQVAVRAAAREDRLPVTSASGFVGMLPVSGDVIAYLADEDLDPLDSSSFSAATRHAREQAWAYLEVLRTLPGCRSAYIVSTGPELGFRQGRHMVSRVDLLDAQIGEGAIGDNAVALGAWPSEYHPGVGVPSEWQLIGGDGAFGITLDNLRSLDTENLYGAGRVLGGERRIGASVRVLGTAFATGHAAGVAAALHIAAAGAGAGAGAGEEDVRRALISQRAVVAL
jgi:hypothetical protein